VALCLGAGGEGEDGPGARCPNAPRPCKAAILEGVMNSIKNGIGMRKTWIAKTTVRPWNPHSYGVFTQVHNTL
jgi:hypothetical protein